jgi:transcriptional regulator with XRE-family HTH domain
VYLRFFEGLTQSEIAERVGISQMHVSRLLSKSLEVLRDHASDAGTPEVGGPEVAASVPEDSFDDAVVEIAEP